MADTDNLGGMPADSAPEYSERTPIIRAHITNPKDMADMFLSLDRLRDSDYARKWHDFPTTKDEMQAVLKEIRVDGVKHGEYYINDFESSVPGLAEHLTAGADIDELNYLAVKLAGMDDFQLEKFSAALEYGVFREGLADIINTAENLDCFDLQPAFNAEQYGEFLIEAEKDNTSPVLDRLEHSSNPDERAFAGYILRLEANVDAAAYGRAVAEEEKGVFTGHGYLTKEKALAETYTGINDIPPEYRVSAPPERPAGLYKMENTDITDFVYKLHALAGDYTSDAAYNARRLALDGGADYCVIMNDAQIRVESADTAYQDGTEINSVFRMFPHDTRAYLLHVDRLEDGRAFGTALLVDGGALSEDIAANTIPLSHVDAEMKIEPATAFFGRCTSEAEAIEPAALLGLLNHEYMRRAENPQPGMLRIPPQTAKDMLINNDAPVYRLMPNGAERLNPVTAITTGLCFQSCREFAVKESDRAGIDKLCGREIDRITGKRPERQAPDKPKSHGAEL